MQHVMVRYKVKPERVAENEALVHAVCEAFEQSPPDDLCSYATFKLEDGVTFVHVAVIRGDGNPLADVPAFQRFRRDLDERCDERLVRTPFSVVGSFRWLDAGG